MLRERDDAYNHRRPRGGISSVPNAYEALRVVSRPWIRATGSQPRAVEHIAFRAGAMPGEDTADTVAMSAREQRPPRTAHRTRSRVHRCMRVQHPMQVDDAVGAHRCAPTDRRPAAIRAHVPIPYRCPVGPADQHLE